MWTNGRISCPYLLQHHICIQIVFLTQYDDFLNIDISQGSIATFYMFIFWRMVRWCQVKSSIIISAVVFKKERICSTSGTVLSWGSLALGTGLFWAITVMVSLDKNLSKVCKYVTLPRWTWHTQWQTNAEQNEARLQNGRANISIPECTVDCCKMADVIYLLKC